MRVAAIYDIHGNLPALEAVLEDVRQDTVDLLVVGGDVLPGPMPGETIDRLQDIGISATFIQGNGDREVLAVLAGIESAAVPESYRPVMAWVAHQLRPDQVQWLESWLPNVTIDVTGLGEVLFCHATPRSDAELFTRLTPEDQLRSAFAGLTTSAVVCGHTHMQFERRIGDVCVLNAGSVGMPFGAPGAYWLVLGPTNAQFRHTAYDLSAAAARIRATDYPQAAEFAANNVLNPPPEERMLQAFTRASRR